MNEIVNLQHKFPKCSDGEKWRQWLEHRYGLRGRGAYLAQPKSKGSHNIVYPVSYRDDPKLEDDIQRYEARRTNAKDFPVEHQWWLWLREQVQDHMPPPLETVAAFIESHANGLFNPAIILGYQDGKLNREPSMPRVATLVEKTLPAHWTACHFVHRDFHKSTLNGVYKLTRFTDCKFSGVSFLSSDLSSAIFDACQFDEKCSFNSPMVQGTTFAGCTFHNVDFRNWKLLKQAQFIHGCHFVNCTMPRDFVERLRNQDATLERNTNPTPWHTRLQETFGTLWQPDLDARGFEAPLSRSDFRNDPLFKDYVNEWQTRHDNEERFPIEASSFSPQLREMAHRVHLLRHAANYGDTRPMLIGYQSGSKRKTTILPPISLCHTELIAATIRNTQFDELDLVETNLDYSQFEGCHFNKGDFSLMHGFETRFGSCGFHDIAMHDANLAHMNFLVCHFSNIDFRECHHFDQAHFDASCHFSNCTFTPEQKQQLIDAGVAFSESPKAPRTPSVFVETNGAFRFIYTSPNPRPAPRPHLNVLLNPDPPISPGRGR